MWLGLKKGHALSPQVVAIARDHARFVQSLVRQRTLFERRFYIVVPWSGTNDLLMQPYTLHEARSRVDHRDLGSLHLLD